MNLELSTFHTSFTDIETIHRVLDPFAAKHPEIMVKLKRMHWMTSWSDLISVASFGSGPDISQIGDTWISSLTGLNAIRPFKEDETAQMGGDQLFSNNPPSPVWALPWSKYCYVICYRKDLLEDQGINPQTAFSNQRNLAQTIQTLKEASRLGQWLMPFVSQPYPDLLHIAAAWIWGAGGDFLNLDQRQPRIVFHKPEALRGWKLWLEAYRAISPGYQRLNAHDSFSLFSQGQACAVVANIRMATSLLETADETTREMIGFAPLSEVPWLGGDSLVIWKYTQREALREQMALELVKYLTSAEGMYQFCKRSHSMPARDDTLQQLYPQGNPLHEAVAYINQHGRRYPAINQWRPVENQLLQELDLILHKGLLQPDTPAEEIFEQHIAPLAERLNRTLGN